MRIALALAVLAAVPASRATSADSVRREVGSLAAQGLLDEAWEQVGRSRAELPAVWQAMFAGKLELDGEAAARGYTGAAADSAPAQMRGEAEFRLGQYHYAAGRHHFAIPQFRLYLSRHPDGTWSQESAYWMALSCLQFVKRRPDKAAYLDTAEAYIRLLEARGRSAYYWPLARAAHARLHLLRGDTAEASRALRDARAHAPAEEMPGVLLLSLQAEPSSPDAGAWEDTLRWKYSLSPEARLRTGVLPPAPAPRTEAQAPAPIPPWTPEPPAPPALSAPPSRGTHALQLGAFAQRENADRLKQDLAGRKIDARVEPMTLGDRVLYRVLAGDYPSAEAAAADGKRRLDPYKLIYRVVETR